VKIVVPEKGRRSAEAEKKKELLAMALENARLIVREKREARIDDLLREIKERVGLKRIPEDIGAFDVSTIAGNESVGAFVYWRDGEFKKEKYRRLRIKTVKGIDDYAMMEEIIERIIKNLEGDVPDLLIIDGGKGQLEIAKRAVQKHKELFQKPPLLAAIAKDPDRLYLITSEEPLDLEDAKPSSLLLKKIRDEAHRFAIGYHRKLRERELMQSPLEKIPGIGKKRRLALLRHFGSVEAIKNATIDEIAQLKGFNKMVAENILKALRR